MFRKIQHIEHDTFFSKGYSRIFVLEKKHIKKVVKILKTFDEDEFEEYFPEYLDPNEYVTVWNETEENELLYTSKFSIDDVPDFIKKCKKEGIDVIVKFKADNTNYPERGVYV